MDEPVSPRTSTTRSIPQCCCGSTDCAHLSRNSELLRSLERDVQTAAQLGQVSITSPQTRCILLILRPQRLSLASLHDPSKIRPRSQHVNTRPS